MNLDNGFLRLDHTLSAVILLDGYFDNDPNAVYRCVFRVQVEDNPPSEEWSPLMSAASESSSRTRTPSDWDDERDGPRGGARDASESIPRTPGDWDFESDQPRAGDASNVEHSAASGDSAHAAEPISTRELLPAGGDTEIDEGM